MCRGIFVVIFVAVIGVFLFEAAKWNYTDTILLSHYDFIVVGAGAGGAVVANRLTENPNVQVLLIEAGEDQNYMYTWIPGAANDLINSEVDWKYQVVKGNNVSFLGNKGFYPRGKTVGGSTSIK
jgi:choline dehydrogenase